MHAAYVTVTLAAAAANVVATAADYRRPQWLLHNLDRLGVPERWLPGLAALKVAGAAGLLLGFALPAIGTAAAAGLVVYFLGAVATVLWTRRYEQWYPLPLLAMAAGALVLRLAIG